MGSDMMLGWWGISSPFVAFISTPAGFLRSLGPRWRARGEARVTASSHASVSELASSPSGIWHLPFQGSRLQTYSTGSPAPVAHAYAVHQ